MNQIEKYPFGRTGWTPDRLGDLKGKTYLITGANVGAGFEATKILTAKGARVVMLCRSASKANQAIAKIKRETPNADLRYIHLDLASLDSVRQAAEAIRQDVEKVDALICNAAIAQVAKHETTQDGFESQLGVNHYGHFLLCGLLFEQIESSKGRIVVVGSMGYKMGLKKIQFEDLDFDKNYNPMNTYCHSKLAQMMFAYELQKRAKEAGKSVLVQVCHPGAARTTLAKDEANLTTKVLFKLLSPFAQSAERGAWPEVLCATENYLETEALYGPTKRAEMAGPVGRNSLLEHVLDRGAAAKLWAISEQKTKFAWSL